MGYLESLLGNNEQIVFGTRRHWMVLARSIFVNAFFILVIIVLTIVAWGAFQGAALVLTVFFLAPIISFMREYLAWWNEEYIVTNRRVIQSEGIINKHVIDSSLEKVNDVVLDQSMFGRLFDYGTLEVLTASEIGINKLHQLARPVKFKTEMLNQKEKLSENGRHEAPPARRNDIPTLLADLDNLRKQGVLTEEEFQQKKAQLLSKM